jgi:hypothetical protein
MCFSTGTAALEAYSESFPYSMLAAAVYSAMKKLEPFSDAQRVPDEDHEKKTDLSTGLRQIVRGVQQCLARYFNCGKSLRNMDYLLV